MADQHDDAVRAPGWKRDPWRRFAGRYWDGEQWTEHVVTAEKVRALDPVPATPPAAPVPPPPAAAEPALAPTVAMETATAVSSPTSRPWSTTWSSIRGWPRWAQWTAGIFVLLLLIGAATGGSDEDQDAPRSVVGDSVTTLTLPLAETTVPTTTTLATTTTAAPTSTTLAPTTVPPTVATTVATTAPATTRATTASTAAPNIQQGVTPGAFCSPGGARGVTSTGVDMICTTTATDERNRWRRA
jgi:hypothetical protein